MAISRQIILVVIFFTTTVGCPGGKTFPDLTEMVSIAGGIFTMGLNPGKCEDGIGSICEPDASPVHDVNLSPYFIDKHEVTNGQYRHCVYEGECDPPTAESKETPHKNPDFFNHPVTNVTWHMAGQYCKWAKRRLPTEAEWEFAARASGFLFPWGNALADVTNCDHVYLQHCPRDDRPGPVAEAPGDIINHREKAVHDLGGNVAEWVSDLYGETSYCENAEPCEQSEPGCIHDPCGKGFSCIRETSLEKDPQGPKSGSLRAYRGGSFADDRCYGAGFVRRSAKPSHHSHSIGFRCARDWEPGKDPKMFFDQGVFDLGIDNRVPDISVVDTGLADKGKADMGAADFGADIPKPANNFIFHYDGQNWSSQDSQTTKILNGAWGSGPSDVFAVGYDGVIVHYDGQTWTSQMSWTSWKLNGIWGSGPSDVFAVGDAGVVVHYDGQNWSFMDPGLGDTLNAVWGSGPDDVYAGGESNLILHYNGIFWSKLNPSHTVDSLQGIWGSSPIDIFMIDVGGTILHYNGESWFNMTGFTGPWSFGMFGVWGSGPTDVYIVGGSGWVMHYQGFDWYVADSSSDYLLKSVWGSGPSDIYTVGRKGLGSPESGYALHYDGQNWSSLEIAISKEFNGVWGSGPSDIFVVGNP